MILDLTETEQAKLDSFYVTLKEAEDGYKDTQARLAQLQSQLGLIQGRFLGAIEMVTTLKNHAPEDVAWTYEAEHVVLTVKDTLNG